MNRHMLEVRHAIEHKILARMEQDPQYRAGLIANPRHGLEQLGATLPPKFQVFAIEEAPDTLYIVMAPDGSAT
ncbi:MAG TPA: hypothetical protein VM536_00805 [Chloroflexia bacterium]|nr:hypothetical protein [Chloroflexia bacterium]